jgi:hypothetical protein
LRSSSRATTSSLQVRGAAPGGAALRRRHRTAVSVGRCPTGCCEMPLRRSPVRARRVGRCSCGRACAAVSGRSRRRTATPRGSASHKRFRALAVRRA